ncbi:hypothetical protein F66182_3312 [Fusarium sp. NRRL 66182]|nr:hypothetical protein F66182_3312 [Fusarium sp. NRRL 66182]
MDIQSLPTELLRKILFHVRNGDCRDDAKNEESIKQCRLVSQCFNNAASPFMITDVCVWLTLESVARFENLCKHPVFSKSLQSVVVFISYYEAELARDKQLYMEEAKARLLRHVETWERTNYYRRKYPMTEDIHRRLSALAWGQDAEREIVKLVGGSVDEASATPVQKLLNKMYDLYQQKYANQERLFQNEAHISRLCAALCSLPNLESLRLEDDHIWRSDTLDAADFPDSGLESSMLQHFFPLLCRSRWCGSFMTAHTATPPVEMLGDLLARLGEKGLRLKRLALTLTNTPDMRVWHLSWAQKAEIKRLVSQSTEVRLQVDFGARAYDLQYPKDEMLAVCSISQAIFSAPHLEDLTIGFKKYPHNSATPNVSLSDILPLATLSPRLRTLDLFKQPATVRELELLVSRNPTTVRNFDWFEGWLLEGNWPDAVDMLRGFECLENASLEYPHGLPTDVNWSADEIKSYVLRETNANPLRKRSKGAR